MTAVPVDVETFDDWTDDLPSQFVEVHMLTRSRVKHHARLRIAGGTSIRIQNFRQLSNDRNWLRTCACFRLVDQTFPNRAVRLSVGRQKPPSRRLLWEAAAETRESDTRDASRISICP